MDTFYPSQHALDGQMKDPREMEPLQSQPAQNDAWRQMGFVQASPPPMEMSVVQESVDDLVDALSIGTRHDYSPGVPTLTLAYQSSTTQIYRQGKEGGIKVILAGAGHCPNPDPSAVTREESISRLEIERRISNHLPQSLSQRKITKLDAFNGNPAVFFEWVDGITLSKWLEQGPVFDLNHRLRTAIAITRTLAEYHAVGVAHNRLSTSNIILDISDRHCIATLIDLSKGVISHDGGLKDKRADLKDLGRVFCELFRENGSGDYEDTKHVLVEDHSSVEDYECLPTPSKRRGKQKDAVDVFFRENGGERYEDTTHVLVEDDEHSPSRSKKRGKKRGKQKDAVDDLPLYLSSLIPALMSACNDDCEVPGERYEDIKHVLADLNAAAKKYGIYFRPYDEATSQNRLHLQRGAFYGRQSELAVLMHSLNSVMILGQPVMTAVSGHGGMGKTTLVNQIIKPLKERHGYLITGKFDQKGRRPDSVIFSAIDSFFGSLMEGGDHDVKARLKKRITDVVGGFGANVLTKSIPNLGNFVENAYTHTCNDQVSRQVLLCKLISAIADQMNPIVIIIDDLQWADETSLNVLKMIATDPDITYCLCIGCYRDDDKVLTQKVTNMLNGIKSLHVSVMAINLAPLEKESVNTMISEVFCLPPSLSQKLSSIVFNKTAGGPIYVVKLLQSLCEEGLIRFSLTARRWEYQIGKIGLKVLPAGVVQYMTVEMEKLPHSYRLVLEVAACLGHPFDYHTFKKAKVQGKLKLEDLLPRVAAFGFIQELAPNQFAWAHDQVQQAAYGLIPENRREAFHLLIGTKLLMNTPESELEKSIFDIVGQINIGKRLLDSDDQKYEVGELYLLAGEQALKTSSFHSAAKYFMSGIELLQGGDCWESEYNLSMKLHDAALEALFATGEFTTLSMLTSKILTHARNFDDKLNCYQYLVRYLASSRQSEKGISTCITVLEQVGETKGIAMGLGFTMGLNLCNFLGETLPTKISDVVIYTAYRKTKRLLDKYSEDDILRLPQMVDERKLVAMDFLNHMISSSNGTRPHLNVLVVIRMVELTLEYGLCDVSACAFSGYGNVNCLDQDFESGYRFGYVALKIMARLGKENLRFQARVYTNVYGFINIWREPFQASLPKLLEGYDAGCLHGDMEYSYWQIQIYCGLSLISGEDLAKLQQNATKYAKRAMQHNQSTVANGIVTLLSAFLELTGDANSRDGAYEAILNCTEDALYQQLASSNEDRACALICNKGKFVSILKGNIDDAVQYYHMGLKHPFGMRTTSINIIMGHFTDGLIALICAQELGDDQGQWTNVGLGVIKKMKKWMPSSPWNFANKVYLLEAEHFVLKGNYELAREKYEASIKAAQSHRFVHEEGLAFERAGNFYLDRGRRADAVSHFTQAKRCYELWGAQALVDCIAEKCKGTFNRSDSMETSIVSPSPLHH